MPSGDAQRDLLDALGLEEAPPSPRAFEELFLRFQARVPFRRGPAEASADPAVLLRRFAGSGRGGCGEERREAFAALARGLGYRLLVVPARKEDGSVHGALVADLDGEEVLADVSLPLPVLVPLRRPGVEIPSALGTLGVEREGEAWRLLLSGLGRTAPLLTAAGVGTEETEAVPPGDGDLLLRFLPDRALRWARGRMEVLDAWSVLGFPLAGAETATLGALFDQPVDDLSGVPADAAPPSLTVFHATADPPDVVVTRLTAPDRFAGLLPPGIEARDVLPVEGGWEWEVATDGGELLRRERVRIEERGIHVATLGEGHPFSTRRFVVEPEDDGSRLVLESFLAEAFPPAGPADAVRRTLVFHLAAELIALAAAEGEPR